jgi:hypothetical protein
MKVYVVRGEYAEDGTYVVAANSEEEVKAVINAKHNDPDFPTWQDDFFAEELSGVVTEGPARLIWG